MSKIKRHLEDWLIDNQINGDDGTGLVPISECDCLSYMREVASAAERLIELAKEREAMR